MLLELQDVVVHYAKVEAVRGVSLTVEEGAIVALIGANGAGKTTILRTISGLERPTSGRILFRGEAIEAQSTAGIVRLGISHVPEGRRVFPQMTVRDNLLSGAWLRAEKAEILRDLEGTFDHFPVLRQRQRQSAGSLSGGEQQMLAVGRALMARPRLMLLDEPTIGLAPMMVAEIARIVGEICQKGVSVMLVEQNAVMALGLAQKGYVLENGKVLLEGEAGALMSNEYLKSAYLGG